jgi:hypothetical protein
MAVTETLPGLIIHASGVVPALYVTEAKEGALGEFILAAKLLDRIW